MCDSAGSLRLAEALSYTIRVNLRFAMTTGRGSATILTGWIVRHNEDFPRLTTCYIV